MPNQFDLHVGLGGGYTTNPPLAADSERSKGDSITDFRVDLTGRRSSPRTDWSVTYDSFYTRYGTNDQLDNLNHALNFDGRYQVTRRSRLTLFEHFFYSRNPLRIATTEPTDETIILTRQTRRWRGITDAAMDTSLSRSVTLQFGASSRIERLDLDPPVNIDSYSGRLGIQKQFGPRDSISSTLRYSQFNFHQEGVAASETRGVDLSWTHGVPTQTEWVLSAGFSTIDRGGARQDRILAAASLHHPFRRLDVVCGYRRSLDADAGVTTLTLAQNAYAGISGRLGQRALLGLLGEYGTRKSVLEGGDQLALTYAGGTIHGSIALNQRLSISGDARRRKQDVTGGTGPGLTVDSFFLGLDLLVF